MIKLIEKGVFFKDGKLVRAKSKDEQAAKGTLAYKILSAHNLSGNDKKLNVKFDEITSHDITYVGIIQTAKASGLDKFPIPYTLTNCHNSLCAVGGTINEDDHVFGLSAAKKYGGAFVPPHLAVIHQYMREMRAFCGGMILGSDSHTRYGALGTLAVGEGGPELVKQLLNRTYDVDMPEVVAVYLKGRLRKGVGPHDVALALVKATFKNGFVKNRVLEFIGNGVKTLSMDFRNGIDVMTTETTCLSSVWVTDEKTKKYYEQHGRVSAYKEMSPDNGAYYDRGIVIDLSKVEPMIALPFHPSNAYTIKDFLSRPYELLKEAEEAGQKLLPEGKGTFKLTDKIKDGKVYVEQGVIAGCAGGMYENIAAASEILGDTAIDNNDFTLDVYPSSQPVYKGLVEGGYIGKLMDNGAVIKTAFCGPCFGAGDVPQNNGLSIRHTTRNFESREGSKPANGQLSAVALMDARSIAATAKNGGAITSAMDMEYSEKIRKYRFENKIYKARVFNGVGNADNKNELVYGPNIADWPKMQPLKDNLLLKVVSVLNDPVTTTDELIPSGETSSYRSNPLKLAEFALSRKDPLYVGRAKAVRDGAFPTELGLNEENTSYGSVVCSVKPGDGSAREQAASCQRVLGGVANIAKEYATKRYRSNLINWGMLPFLFDKNDFKVDEYIYVENVKEKIANGAKEFTAKVIGDNPREIVLKMDALTDAEKQIILKGCLINYYKG
ncbi:MAG: hydratase [Clostridiales bacterium]|nr:hydratase [Clostridiales bacterium]